MRVVCINIPKAADGPATAIYATKWEQYWPKFFMHQLDELAETLWEPFSLEMYSTGKTVYFCMAGSDEMIDVLATGIYSWLGAAQIVDIDDYTESLGNNGLVVGTDLNLWRPDIYPVQNWVDMQTDSLIPVLMPLQQIPEDDRLLIQIIVRPLRDSALTNLSLRRARAQERFRSSFRIRNWFKTDLPVNSQEKILWKCCQHLFSVNYRISAFCVDNTQSEGNKKRATLERLKGHVERVALGCHTYSRTHDYFSPTYARRLREHRPGVVRHRSCTPRPANTITRPISR
jgi:hypothetical protein